LKTFLQFSGGKDSIAVLHLLRAHWDKLTVVWLCTDAALPETVEYMRDIEAIVPHFLVVRGRQTIAERGYPADLVPSARTKEAALLHPLAPGQHRFQSKWDCCLTTISYPLHAAMVELGAECIIRGSKKSDGFHSPIEPGSTFLGIRYELPIWEWTDAQVREYLDANGIELPDHYATMNTGLDCWNCTAYLYENQGKLAYLRQHHPAKFEHVRDVLRDLERATDAEAPHLHERLKELTCP